MEKNRAPDRSEAREARLPHTVILKEREQALLSGVTDVVSFDEMQIEAVTSKGVLVMTGEGLHIESLSVETGDLVVEGRIDSLVYTAEESAKKTGFWTKVFR